MSIDRCDACNRPVDTDQDDECYTYVRGYHCVCKLCRDLETVNATLGSREVDSTLELPAISSKETEARGGPVPPDS
jgi:hypothetical protein